MPDWIATSIGVVAGILAGIGGTYLALVWYFNRNNPM